MKRRRDWRPAYTPSPVSVIETAARPADPIRYKTPPSRQHRTTVNFYTEVETKMQLKLLAIRARRTQESLINEALDMLLNKYGRVKLTMPRND